MARPTLREWLQDAPFSLALSAGFFGFYAHAGFVAALEEANVANPQRVLGASAGALVAGLWASGMDAAALERELSALRREHFWDPGFGFGLLRGELFRERLEALAPGATFEGARVPAALSVFDLLRRRTEIADSGPLAPAIHGSCALPGLFQPTRVGGRWVVDGGVLDRPAHAALRRGERVLYHHLTGKSPWRTEAPRVPARDAMVAVVIEGLPRLGPTRLAEGPRAFDRARRAARAALERPAGDVIDA